MSIPSPIAAGRLSLRCFRIRSPAFLFAVLGLFVTPQAMVPAHAETMQQGWVGDLPIMRGMRIEPELGFAFDSPGRRIVLATIHTARTDGFLRQVRPSVQSLLVVDEVHRAGSPRRRA